MIYVERQNGRFSIECRCDDSNATLKCNLKIFEERVTVMKFNTNGSIVEAQYDEYILFKLGIDKILFPLTHSLSFFVNSDKTEGDREALIANIDCRLRDVQDSNKFLSDYHFNTDISYDFANDEIVSIKYNNDDHISFINDENGILALKVSQDANCKYVFDEEFIKMSIIAFYDKYPKRNITNLTKLNQSHKSKMDYLHKLVDLFLLKCRIEYCLSNYDIIGDDYSWYRKISNNSTFESDVIMNINNNSIDINGSIYIYKYDYRNKCAITIEKDSKNDECSLISSKFVDEIIDKFNDKSHDINTLMERSITGLSSFVQKFYEDSLKNVCDYIDISDSDDITIFF